MLVKNNSTYWQVPARVSVYSQNYILLVITVIVVVACIIVATFFAFRTIRRRHDKERARLLEYIKTKNPSTVVQTEDKVDEIAN